MYYILHELWLKYISFICTINSFLYNNKVISYESNKLKKSDVTIILTIWKRSYIEEQIKSLLSQSIKPDKIWIIKYENHQKIAKWIKNIEGIVIIESNINLKYFGRFSLAQYIETKYVWILDDDVIPGKHWIENCINASLVNNYIISCAGRRIPKETYYLGYRNEIDKYYFGDITPGFSFHFCKEDTIVDFGCNGWFFQTEWIKNFWQIPPTTLDMSEDMHLSAVCKIKLGVQTIVLKQLDENSSGNLKITYGRDRFASWTKGGFYEKREKVLHYLIDELGWKPLLWN